MKYINETVGNDVSSNVNENYHMALSLEKDMMCVDL